MNLGFIINDTIRKTIVKFIPATLPTAVKSFNLKTVHQTELDVSGIAAKAAVFNIHTNPKVIEEGLNAGFELMYYLAATGYSLKTPLFDLKIGIPGEYDGTETHLPDGIFPRARIRINRGFRKYLEERVRVEFDGKDLCESIITEARDEATGAVSTVMTRGNILTINGTGLKIEADDANADKVGLFFVAAESGARVKASTIALNNPRSLIVHVPAELKKGQSYRLVIDTQSTPRRGGGILKNIRNFSSAFTLTAA